MLGIAYYRYMWNQESHRDIESIVAPIIPSVFGDSGANVRETQVSCDKTRL